MNSHRIPVASAIILSAVLLSACAPEPASPGQTLSSPTHSSSASATPDDAGSSLPAGAVVRLTGTITAANGAVLDLSLVVRSATAWNDVAGAARVSAIAKWCLGEVDAAVMAAQKFSIAQVDYTAAQVGSTAWPTGLPLMVLPTAQDVSLASSGDVHQIEVLSQPREPGDYVPHCQQSAFLNGAGSGSTYIGFADDAAEGGAIPFTRWANFRYGFTINSPAGFVDSAPFGGVHQNQARFSDCSSTVTPLGSSLGVPSLNWAEVFEVDHCAVGGTYQP